MTPGSVFSRAAAPALVLSLWLTAPAGAEPGNGRWTMTCEATCVLEQRGVGSAMPTVLRLDPREGANAEISIIRPDLPSQGLFTIYMDGDLITEGQIETLAPKRGDRLVMEPGDITAGLLRQMSRYENMVVNFPGEERGVEIQLQGFAPAWQGVLQRE